MMKPELYAKNCQAQKPVIAGFVRKYLDKIKWRTDGKDTLIDIGSGTGCVLMQVVYPLMARQFERIVCSDLSPDMVTYARSQYQHVENSEFLVLEIGSTLEIPQNLRGQFDHVVSFQCLHFVENQMRAFQNIFQLLRANDGGNCLLSIAGRGPYYDVCLALSKTCKWSKYMTEIKKYTCHWHLVEYPEQEARLMLEKCGFTDIEVHLIKKHVDFETEQPIKELLLACSPYIDQIPKELHQDFLNDMLQTWPEVDKNFIIPTDGGEKFRFNSEHMEIFARRPSIAD